MAYTSWLTPEEPRQGEDCLVVNVWAPEFASGSDLPVMVYLHGGGFAYGSASADGLDGSNLARHGVVVVTVNHRLNIFGHLYLDELPGGRFAESGNVALLDILAALEWVRDNIVVFGGNASNVTAFGQSGGGSKVAAILSMPRATGLVHRAIVQSASSALRFATIEEAERNTAHLIRELGLDRAGAARRLLELPSRRLLGAMRGGIRAAGGVDNYRPVVDGRVLTDQPFSPVAVARSQHIPVMTGWCETEQRLRFSFEPEVYQFGCGRARQRVAGFVGIGPDHAAELMRVYAEERAADEPPGDLMALVYGDNRYRRTVTGIAESRAAKRAANTYLYLLTWRSPVLDGLLRTPHSICLPFAFNNIARARGITGTGPDQDRLQDEMAGGWVAFASTGDPNHGDLPEWPPFETSTRPTMVLGQTRVEEDPAAQSRIALAGCPPYDPAAAEGGSLR